jgi:hypothetical protein
MNRIIVGTLIVVTSLFMLSSSNALEQGEPCPADFDCSQTVDANDVTTFLSQFGRSPFSPCPCSTCPYGMIDCGTKCVDPMTDEDYCGVDSTCLGGVVCGATEKCVVGVCEDVGGGGGYPAPVEKTGQTICWGDVGNVIDCTGTGQDGEHQKGVTWPNPRFTDNGDGTVTDNLTGLIWLKNADCIGHRTWNDALSDCNGLASGFCGLTDGSNAGEWRLPNRNELASLIHKGYYNFALPNTAGTGQWSEGDPFINLFAGVNSNYWSSTTDALYTDYAWLVHMYDGFVNSSNKTSFNYVWPVRGGQ